MLESGFGRPIAISLIWLSTLLVARTALSQAERPSAVVQETTDEVRVDGVLDEPDWSRAPTIGPLVQSDDAENLYVGILCRDRTPSAIVIRLQRRPRQRPDSRHDAGRRPACWPEPDGVESQPQYLRAIVHRRHLDGRIDNWQVRVVPLGIRTDSGEEFEYSIQPTFERLVEPFEISDNLVIPPGSYRWTEHEVEVSTTSKRRGVIEFEYRWANFYGGTLHQMSSESIWKPSAHLALLVEVERGHVSLPSGDFVTQFFSGVDYAASADVTWSNLIQYDSDSRILGFQSRFRWILKPGNDLFLVVNRGWFRDLNGRYVSRFDRGSAKLQYTIRL